MADILKNSPYSAECHIIGGSGVEFTCQVPWMKPLYSDFETKYNPLSVLHAMQGNNFVLPVAAICIYVLGAFFGQRYMDSRKPWQWRNQLAYWNFGLSLFSCIGAARTIPQLIYNLQTMSFRDNMCLTPEHTFGVGSTGLWVQLFCLSKFPELLDTFFIVIHKKPLIFLHWYHHVTVLMYCWHSYVNASPSGIFFVAMNYSVHAIMYGYYFLMAVKLKPTWLKANFITLAQISQMIVGVTVTVASFYYYIKEQSTEESNCEITMENNIGAFIMYGSYLFLFCQFYFGRFVLAPPKKKTV
mmetsp:Transcript_23497/g.23932  ORF Transcript_23497/g.23932 Transcript_23497/m.23932 type:complete len:299 (-) Transcript_23497:417-1313(-)